MKKLLSLAFALALSGLSYAGSSTGTADYVTQLIAANGSYLDRSGNGTNWSVATPPGYNASAYSGQPAWVFDGSTSTPLIAAQNYYGGTPFNFTPAIGDWSAVIVADLNSSTSLVDNKVRVLLGSAQSSANRWVFAQKNRQLYFAGESCLGQNTWTSTSVYNGSSNLSVSQPHVIAFAYSNVSQSVAVCVDSCAAGWQIYSLSGQFGGTSSSASSDGTLWAGMSNASSTCSATPYPWYGNVFEVDIFRESLATTGKATRWSTLRDQLRAKYGTP